MNKKYACMKMNKICVTLFTLTSVVCAESMTDIRSSNTSMCSSAQPASGYSVFNLSIISLRQTVEIVLPNSKIVLSVSTKYFEEKGYEFGAPLVPKIEVKESIQEYLGGIDVDWKEFLKQRKHLI